MNINMFFKILIVFVFFLFGENTYATAPFRDAYTTLSNSRFSFKGAINGAHSANSTTFTIEGSGQSDNNTENLFPNDSVCFNGVNGVGCSASTPFTISSIISGTKFGISSALSNSLNDNDRVISTQSSRMTVTFVPQTAVPTGGYIRVIIPGTITPYFSGQTNYYADGMPDSDGFDANKITNANIDSYIQSVSNFTKTTTSLTTTVGATASYHTILITVGGAGIGVGTTCSFIIGDSSNSLYRFINPSPSGSSHVRGVADPYSVTVSTEDATNTTLDSVVTKIIPNDGVMVSANVEMTLQYTISAVSIGTTACNVPQTVTTTATAVPFGSIVNFTSFYNAAQTHTVSTNASAGYNLTVEQNDVLTDSLGTGATIPNTACNSTPCTSTTPQTWTDAATYKGLGYSLQTISGTTPPFNYSSGYKPFSTSPVTILTSAAAANSDSLYSCYRLAVSATQPAGYYFNKLTYIATPRF